MKKTDDGDSDDEFQSDNYKAFHSLVQKYIGVHDEWKAEIGDMPMPDVISCMTLAHSDRLANILRTIMIVGGRKGADRFRREMLEQLGRMLDKAAAEGMERRLRGEGGE